MNLGEVVVNFVCKYAHAICIWGVPTGKMHHRAPN